jgi:hypothetical protein
MAFFKKNTGFHKRILNRNNLIINRIYQFIIRNKN